jgi:hypothetical protein
MAIYDPGAGAFAQLMAQAPQFQAGPGTFTQAAIQNAANRLSIAGDSMEAAALIKSERIRRKQARILRRPQQTTTGDRLRSLLASGALTPGATGAAAGGGGGGGSRTESPLSPLQLLRLNNQTMDELLYLRAHAQKLTSGSGNLTAGAIGDAMGG